MDEYSVSSTQAQAALNEQVGGAVATQILNLIRDQPGGLDPSAGISVVTSYAGGPVSLGTDIVYLDKNFTGTIGNELANVSAIIVPGDGNAQIVLNGGVDRVIQLGGGDDSVVIDGNTRDTVVLAGGGNDSLDLGAGFDRAQIAGSFDDYQTSVIDGKLHLINVATGEEIVLSNTEMVEFGDGSVIVNVAEADDAVIARMYQAALDRDGDAGGIPYWLNDNNGLGHSLQQIAGAFLNSEEFTEKFGPVNSLSDEQFISIMYENTFGRPADAEGLQYWLNDLDAGNTRAGVMAAFASSVEAQVTLNDKVHIFTDIE